MATARQLKALRRKYKLGEFKRPKGSKRVGGGKSPLKRRRAPASGIPKQLGAAGAYLRSLTGAYPPFYGGQFLGTGKFLNRVSGTRDDLTQ